MTPQEEERRTRHQMIEINYTLHTLDEDILHENRQAPLVPRVGELITLDGDRSFQVVDVLWHHWDDGSTSVTITGCETPWHARIADVVDAWRQEAAR